MAAARPKTTLSTFTCGNATATATVPAAAATTKDFEHAIYATKQVLAELAELLACASTEPTEAPST